MYVGGGFELRREPWDGHAVRRPSCYYSSISDKRHACVYRLKCSYRTLVDTC